MESEYEKKAILMNPIDDDFLKKMAEDLEFCQEVIQIATNNRHYRVVSCHPQETVKNLQGRSVILDILCKDAEDKPILVEVQKKDDDHHVKRVRYNTSLITANITEPGERFENIKDIISIYISKNDFIGKHLEEKDRHAVYHVDRIVRENGLILDNGITEIYINAKIKDGSDASRLMEVFTENDAYDYAICPKTSMRKWYLKNTEKGVKEMCTIVEEIVKEAVEETERKTKEETTRELVRKYFLESDDIHLAKKMFIPTLSEEEILEIYNDIYSVC